MKIYLGPYKNWFGPRQLAEKLCFWAKDVKDEHGFNSKPEWIHTFGDFLAHGTAAIKNKERRDVFNEDEDLPESWMYRLLKWIDSKKKRRVYIRIDKYDTWNMGGTLSMIILPMLKQLKATKHGSPQVETEDVPEELRMSDENDYDIIHRRWAWVLDEMIWAFEQHQPDVDWEAQYTTGKIDFRSEPCNWDADGKPTLYQLKEGPKHTAVTDWVGRQKHQDRITNGFRLFGKYYQGLWD